MSYDGAFTITDRTLGELRLAILAYKISHRNSELDPVLDAATSWLDSMQPQLSVLAAAHGLVKSGFGDALVADLVEGLEFLDPQLDAVRIALLEYLRRKPTPPPPPPPPSDTDPIVHGPETVNVLHDKNVWVPGSFTRINAGFTPWLRRFCLGGPTTLVIADMEAIPEAMHEAGFRGRDNALWYSLSRSYAEWPWSHTPSDPDEHLWDQQRELHDFWSNYMEVILSAMKTAPQTRAVFLQNDDKDRCGDVLSEYSLRQLQEVAGRIERGGVFQE